MRRLFFFYLFCLGAQSIYAQNDVSTVRDTIQADIDSVTQGLNVVEKSTEEKLQVALLTIEEQKKHLLELRDIETKLELAQREKTVLEKKAADAEKHAESVEKSLISMASNFLYIPYEAYGVEEIAVKAFESIHSIELKQEYNQRYILLKNYQKHLREFKVYLEKVQKACNGVFQATATEYIDPIKPSVSPELVLKQQPFYLEYVKYSDYQNTFIGGLLLKTEELLKAHTKQNRANLQGVIKTIDKTQEHVKIDSVEGIINTIDERLKTVEEL